MVRGEDEIAGGEESRRNIKKNTNNKNATSANVEGACNTEDRGQKKAACQHALNRVAKALSLFMCSCQGGFPGGIFQPDNVKVAISCRCWSCGKT